MQDNNNLNHLLINNLLSRRSFTNSLSKRSSNYNPGLTLCLRLHNKSWFNPNLARSSWASPSLLLRACGRQE